MTGQPGSAGGRGLARLGTRGSPTGRVRITGIALSAPGWWNDVDLWCEVAGITAPAEHPGSSGRVGRTRRLAVNLTFLDESDITDRHDPPLDGAASLACLEAETDSLDLALARVRSRGGDILTGPSRDDLGRRSATVSGPGGTPIRLVETNPTGKLATARSAAPRATETYLAMNVAASALLAVALTGYLSHLAVLHAPRHQVSFGFLVGFCALLAGGNALIGYPAGLRVGEDACTRSAVRPLRSEVAGTDQADLASNSRDWRYGARLGLLVGGASALALGLASAVLLGRPVGFWLLWAWAALFGGIGMVLPGALARRRGVLLAGRRALGLTVAGEPPSPVLRRTWLGGALPVALFSMAANAGLAWVAYRFGVTTKALGSDMFGSVVVTGGLNYVLGSQWGRTDWRAGRIVVPQGMHLPPKVRLGAQGLLFVMVAVLVATTVGGHAIPNPPSLGDAIAARALAGMLVGGLGFALGNVAGALNAAADDPRAAVAP